MREGEGLSKVKGWFRLSDSGDPGVLARFAGSSELSTATNSRSRYRSGWSATGIALFTALVVLVVGSPALGAGGVQYPGPSGTFTDDDGSVHEENIEAMVVAGITQGCGENLYCPGDEITRAQVASFLDRALELPTTDTDFFSDDNGSVHEAAINRIAAAGITQGCGTRLYCPARPLTRAQMATLLARTLSDLTPATADYFADDDGSRHEDSINVLAENGIAQGCSTGLFCPNDPVRRSAMASFLARSLQLKPARPPEVSPWRLEPVLGGIEGGTTDLQAPAGDDRLFLATKDGLIRIIRDGTFLTEPFLDLREQVRDEGSEQGLLGLVFHPGFDTNRRFYVFYSAADGEGHSRVFEYLADASDPDRADPSTARHIITFEQRPTSPTHKGGQLRFGADGYLYIAVGDGGGQGDPFEHGENPKTELGTIIRIDVDVDPAGPDPYLIPPDNPFADGQDGLPEVWAYGLRNPWRFSFDGPYIYIADVGRLTFEELNIADAAVGGIDYGWDTMEGTACHEPPTDCDTTGFFRPQVVYPRDDGLAVIGGYVYRGSAIPEMVGHYFYADFVAGWIRTFRYDGEVTEHYDWSRSVDLTNFVWSFGVDGHGELYVLDRWAVWKIVPNRP